MIQYLISNVGDLDPESDPVPQDPHVFGLLDPDSLVRGTDPAPDPSLFS